MALIRRLPRSSVQRAEASLSSRDFEVVDADWFAHAGPDSPLSEGEPVVLPFGRIISEADRLRTRKGRGLGARLGSDTRFSDVQPYLDMLDRIEIEFPKFTDGRGYTLARRLRDQGRFGGELVAVGDVLRDQALYLVRSGFDVLAVAPHRSADDVLRAFDEMGAPYQAAHDEKLPLFRRVAR